MSAVVENQRDYRLKEAIGRHIAEGLHSKVWWWSVGQSMIILLIGFGQVLILKTFFTEKSPIQTQSIET
jgi:protein ERP2